MNKLYLTLLILFSVPYLTDSLQAQHFNGIKRCGTMEHLEYLKQKLPDYESRLERDKKNFNRFRQNNSVRNSNQVITIPVVVHVVYKTTGQRISLQQIQSQIDVLNEDFGRKNSDTTLTPAIFKNRAANSNIRFCLAKEDPAGAVTDGVVYVETNVTAFSDNDDIKRTSAGGSDPWDVTKYFNIWVGNLSGGLLGYAEFPSSSPSPTFGVVIKYTAFGRTGTVIPPYNKGRTATHEIAHCFNLTHIWGDEPACINDDGMADTPLQKDNNFGCPSFPQGPSKSGGCCDSTQVSSMFMNYMDYTDDGCMNLFTHDQADEMNASVQFFNSSLLSSNVCNDFIGIKENEKKLNVTFTNPVNDLLIISVEDEQLTDGTIRLFDCLGKEIRTTRLAGKTTEISLKGETPGLYYILIKSEDRTYTGKLILQ